MTQYEVDLPQGCQYYSLYDEVPADIVKYWHQRYDIFSKYDEGVWLSDTAWYGVTPEIVADYIAKHVAEAAPVEKTVLIDAFAGVGGNTIAFAKSGRWERIFAIEKDPVALQCAKHNAEIYGVSKKIFWVEGDSFVEVKKRFTAVGKNAVIFASPPWGGPEYRSQPIFDLSTMQPYNLQTIFEAFCRITPEIILYLPRTSDLRQLAKFVPPDKNLIAKHYCVNGASKALCAYYGNFMFPG